jgi:hypothetical protein
MDNQDLLEIPPFLRRTLDERDQPEPDALPSNEAEEVAADELEPHPFADMFPMMTGEDFDALVASIKEHKLEEPIIKYKGKILDGRNRYAACTQAGGDPKFREYEGDDPLGFVLRKNLHRRQLQTSQRAMIAAKMANLPQGGDHKSDDFKTSNDGLKIEDAAKRLNVSEKTVERAKAVLTCGDEELIKAVEKGTKSVSAAAKQLAEHSPPPVIHSEGELQSQRLLKLWKKTGEEGRAMFLEEIGATI